MRPESLGFVGLGAVGGSVAWAARRAGVSKVIAFADDNRETFRAARVGAITEIAHDPSSVVRTSSLVMLAGTGEEVASALERIAPEVRARGVIVTDLACPKRITTRAAERLELSTQFAGSAPVVSSTASDMSGASPELLKDAIVYVTPLPNGDRAAAEISDFWHRVIGAHPVMIDMERHDALVAWTTHLPHTVASALAVALARHGPSGVTHTGATLDGTRLALGDAQRLAAVLLENRDHVCATLDAFGDAIGEIRRALVAGDAEGVVEWIETGAAWRRRFER